MRRRAAQLLLWPVSLAAAGPSQNALTPAGTQAASIHLLLWLQVIVLGAVFIAVMGFLLF